MPNRLSLAEEREIQNAIAQGFVPLGADDDSYDPGTLSDAREFLQQKELARINEQRRRAINNRKKRHGSRGAE